MARAHANPATGRRPADLITALLSTHAAARRGGGGTRAVDLAALGRSAAAAGLWRDVAAPGGMLGPLAVAPRVRKVVARRARDPPGPQVRPQEAPKDDGGEVQATDGWVAALHGAAAAAGTTPLARLVACPGSYGQTVENVFALSFLVK